MTLADLSVHELCVRLNARDCSAQQVVASVFERIAERDPLVGAFLTITRDEALARARDLDTRRSAGESLGPLAGVPIAVKDNICTHGIRTTCGSRILEGFVPPYDATVVARLIDAGAIIVGKTNLDEFAMGSSTENSALGTTRNPWDLSRVPGGSSGGSAAAVAAGLVPASLGSDTGGSIRLPAALCGVVGMKPTYGVLSRFGLIAFASSLDQIGPISRNVADNAWLLAVMSGSDPRDSTCLPEAPFGLDFDLNGGVEGLRIGLIDELAQEGIDSETSEAIAEAAAWFSSNGAEVGSISLPSTRLGIAAYYLIANAEASANLARYDGVRFGLRAATGDLVSMYEQTRAQGFGTEVKRRIMLGTYALSAGYYDAYYKKAQLVRTKLRDDYRQAFERFDVLLSCTSPTTAFPLGERTENPLAMYLADVATVSANLVGNPALTLPCGFDRSGLPIGMQLQGPALSEATLYRAAHAFEADHDFGARRPAPLGRLQNER